MLDNFQTFEFIIDNCVSYMIDERLNPKGRTTNLLKLAKTNKNQDKTRHPVGNIGSSGPRFALAPFSVSSWTSSRKNKRCISIEQLTHEREAARFKPNSPAANERVAAQKGC